MQVLKTTKYLLIMIVILSSCYYDVEDEIYPTTECMTTDMSYALDIIPILEADCYECHSISANNGNVTLEGHENILKYVNDGKLLGAINHDGGFSPMPKERAKLLDCEIAKIDTWITDGALNN